MIRKPLDLPPDVARAFVDDMRAYFAEENPIKRDGIAMRQLRALREHKGPREKSPVSAPFHAHNDLPLRFVVRERSSA